MVYVRGVELTGKKKTFELEFPYSSSFAYAVSFFMSGYLEEWYVQCLLFLRYSFSTLDSRRSP